MAIWQAHEKKCAYTSVLIDPKNMHIDHILPENLTDDPDALVAIKMEMGLPDDFNINGFENLLPCLPGINLQKGGVIFDKRKTMYFLGIAESKVEEIKRLIIKFQTQIENGKAAVMLQGYLESGKISPEDVAEILDNYSGKPKDVFKLIEALSFIDRDEVRIIKKADIAELRKLPIKMGLNSHIGGVTLRGNELEDRFVRSCLEYEEAIRDGFRPNNNFEYKMSIHFEHQCGLLKALESATIPEVSFISDSKVGIVDLHLLPYKMFPRFNQKDDSFYAGISYQDKVDDSTLVIERVKNNLLHIVEPVLMGQQLIEVARADFNEDGIEDILLFENIYAIGGTFRSGRIIIITRKSEDGPFEEVR